MIRVVKIDLVSDLHYITLPCDEELEISHNIMIMRGKSSRAGGVYIYIYIIIVYIEVGGIKLIRYMVGIEY